MTTLHFKYGYSSLIFNNTNSCCASSHFYYVYTKTQRIYNACHNYCYCLLGFNHKVTNSYFCINLLLL